MGRRGATVGLTPLEGLSAHVGEAALGTVEEAGKLELRAGPRRKPVPGGDGVGHVGRCVERDERHDVDNAHPRVGPVVVGDVDLADGTSGHRARRVLDLGSPQREHRAVMVSIAVDVEQARPGGRADAGDHVASPPLAHVDDTLQQRTTPALVRLGTVP